MIPCRSNWQLFKRNINLVDFAITHGYLVNKKKSTKQSICLSDNNNDKIIVSRKNGIWIYFSVYDSDDNGTIVDFVKRRTQKNYAEIFSILSNWDGTSNKNSFVLHENPFYDQKRVQKIFENCTPIQEHQYLNQRGTTKELLISKRFQNTIYTDSFNNVVFPHYKNGNIAALELKNSAIHVFVKGSEKTFWQSNRFATDNHLLIAETAIDALSYQFLFLLKDAFYIAIAGSPSQVQIKYILQTISKFKQVTLIIDNDAGGDKIFNRLQKALLENKIRTKIYRHSPQKRGCDWNNVLMEKALI